MKSRSSEESSGSTELIGGHVGNLSIISGFTSLWELIGSFTNTESSGGSVCMKSVPPLSLDLELSQSQ